MPFVKVVSFYTLGTPYAEAAVRLSRSCQTHCVSLETVGVPAFPSWAHAVRYKPRFIYEQLKKSTTADAIVWTDADSVFCKVPDWTVVGDSDIALHFFKRTPNHDAECLTGTMYFRRNDNTIAFAKQWADETDQPEWENKFTPEQDSLRMTLCDPFWRDNTFHVGSLPPEYCWFDDCELAYGKRKPVIEHSQMSRQCRGA